MLSASKNGLVNQANHSSRTKVVAQAFDLLAAAHDAFVFKTNDLYTMRINELLCTHLAEVSPGAFILDMGGGSGQWSLTLSRAGYKVCLADISLRMLSHAQARLPINEKIDLVCADARMPPFHLEAFQAVLLIGDVLSYLDDPIKALRAMVSISKPGTLFIGTVISQVGFAIRLLRAGNIADARSLLLSGYAVERTKSDLVYLAIREGLPEPVLPLTFCSYTTQQLHRLLISSGLRPITLEGINILKTMGFPKAVTVSHLGLNCEQRIGAYWPWFDISTNLFFVAIV